MTAEIFLSLIIGINLLGWVVIAFVLKHKNRINIEEEAKEKFKNCNFKSDETILFDENYVNNMKKYN